MINLVITLYSAINGIDPSVAFQLARLESNMNPTALSRTNDGGLFQLNRQVYRFHNSSWIFHPTTNTALAMATLSNLKKSCSHKIKNGYVLCYNLGVSGAKKIKNPLSQTYYKKFNLIWRQ
jgi:soluble lytic murein transglycosylase-like protein